MRDYVLTRTAERDLATIADYFKDQFGEDAASSALLRIRERCELLASTPGMLGTPREEVRPGLRSFACRPHVLFFRYSDHVVQILRILHERQDVGRAFPR